EAQRALFPIFLGHIRPPDGCPVVAFLAKKRDDPVDFRQGHAVGSFLSGPWGHRAVVVIKMSVGAQIQVWVVELSIEVFQGQSSFAAFVDDAQDGCGCAHLAYLPCCASWSPATLRPVMRCYRLRGGACGASLPSWP